MKNIQPVIAFGFPLLLSVALLPSFALQPESASAEVREIPAETTLQPSSETGVEEASSSSTSSDAPFASET